jgi:hypothetical protein
MEPLPNTFPQANDSVNSLCRKERIAKDALGFLSDSVDTPGSLDKTDDRPGQVVINNNGAVLKILPSLRTSVRNHNI